MKSHIPVVLVMKNPNWYKWALFFKSMCGKFSLRPHIDDTSLPLPATDPLWPAWDQVDCCIYSWILSSIDDTILDLTMDGDNQTAREFWTAIEGLFRANNDALNDAGRRLQQGALGGSRLLPAACR